jgi:glycosyltransferase involved in cell wall biosynthesis
MRVYVELPDELDVPDWSARHERGQVPDRTPYGLDQIARPGTVVAYRPPLPDRRLRVAATKIRGRLAESEVLGAAVGTLRSGRGTADVVLCMDERTGIPAALVPGGPPVVSGIAWLAGPDSVGRAHAAIAGRALRRMAAVFTQNLGLGPTLAHAWGLPAERVHEVTLGIDPEFYPAAPWSAAEPVVVSVGDDRMRDHATLIESIKVLRGNGSAVRLELATTQSVEFPDELGVLYNRRMGAAMRALYRRSSVVAVALHPNLVGSGLTVAMEAMASARPIVITDNPGMPGYIRHGETGLLVPPGDPAALAGAIGELLADPARARRMGEAGRRAVETRFTSRHMADDLHAVLSAAASR